MSIFDEPSIVVAMDAATGAMKDIDEVPRGLACGCVCPACGQPLIARHGDVLKWHFAHKGETCSWAVEATISRVAMGIVESEGRFRFPAVRYRSMVTGETVEEVAPVTLPVSCSSADVAGRLAPVLVLGFAMRGGIVAETALVIWGSHAPSDDLVGSLNDRGLDIVGIDLGELAEQMRDEGGRHVDRDQVIREIQSPELVRRVLLGDSPCKTWVSNRKGDRAAKADRERHDRIVARQRAERERERAEEERQRLVRQEAIRKAREREEAKKAAAELARRKREEEERKRRQKRSRRDEAAVESLSKIMRKGGRLALVGNVKAGVPLEVSGCPEKGSVSFEEYCRGCDEFYAVNGAYVYCLKAAGMNQNPHT